MKLTKHKTAKTKKKEYYRYDITLPEEIVKKIGWKHGDELECRVNDGRLIIKKM